MAIAGNKIIGPAPRVEWASEHPSAPEPTELARIADRLEGLQHDTAELASQLCIVAERALGSIPTGGVAAGMDKGRPPSAVALIDDLIDGINARLAIANEAVQRLGRLA